MYHTYILDRKLNSHLVRLELDCFPYSSEWGTKYKRIRVGRRLGRVNRSYPTCSFFLGNNTKPLFSKRKERTFFSQLVSNCLWTKDLIQTVISIMLRKLLNCLAVCILLFPYHTNFIDENDKFISQPFLLPIFKHEFLV